MSVNASATLYRAEDIVSAIETAKARDCGRLVLANRRGMVVEIMADDLLAMISSDRERIAGLEKGLEEAQSTIRKRQMVATDNAVIDRMSFRERMEQAETQNERLRKALEPFAKAGAWRFSNSQTDGLVLWTPVCDPGYEITVGDLRVASAALTDTGREGEGT